MRSGVSRQTQEYRERKGFTMKSILILQDALTEYRRPVIDELARYYRITVLHAGLAKETGLSNYVEVIVPQLRIGPFHLQNIASIYRTQRQFDVVISMFDLRWPAYIMPFVRKRHTKWIQWGHRYSDNRLANVVRDFLMKKADRILLYGEEEIPRMAARGVDISKVVVAPNTIHVPNYADMSSADKNSLLFVGRLQPRKRIDLIIRAFSELQERIADNIVLDIVGGGLLDGELRQLADKLGIAQKVIFHGPVQDHAELASVFSRAYAYVSPGPVGLGVLHSFAYGVPVVTLREGRHGPEFKNLSHNQNALILESEEHLGPALEWICNHPEAVQVLGHNAYLQYSQNRTLNHMLAGFRKAIEE